LISLTILKQNKKIIFYFALLYFSKLNTPQLTKLSISVALDPSKGAPGLVIIPLLRSLIISYRSSTSLLAINIVGGGIFNLFFKPAGRSRRRG
jgi:hypothetical protein